MSGIFFDALLAEPAASVTDAPIFAAAAPRSAVKEEKFMVNSVIFHISSSVSHDEIIDLRRGPYV